MNPYYDHAGITIYLGDALEKLKELPDNIVQCCVTSPPYWGLRNYGVEGQMGIEKSPEEYIEKMVKIFREVRRILKPNGVMFLNIGDSYYSNPGNGRGIGSTLKGGNPHYSGAQRVVSYDTFDNGAIIIKPKDLVGIPWRIAFALQSDGYYLRSDIIWNKPNILPESVKDRPTKSHEYIFLMAKSKKYYYDADAIMEKAVTMPEDKSGMKFGGNKTNDIETTHSNNPGKKWEPRKPYDKTQGGGGTSFIGYSGNKKADGTPICGLYRNKRDVWTVPACPYKEAHFATYPPDLIKPCILAGSPVGGIILDPFLGSGTTAYVSKELNRKCIGIELNEEYIKIATKRLSQEVMELS
jgi:DNA modification methylase